MNNLSKSQKDEYATAFAMLALYDGGVSTTGQQSVWQSTFIVFMVHYVLIVLDIVVAPR